MIIIREETIRDIEARETLLDACFGPARFQKTCERLREGRKPAQGLSFIMEEGGAVIGTVRLWHISAGPNRAALMLGPIAIDPTRQGGGHGARLMREALSRAAAQGHAAVLLVGDAPYYERFGFSGRHTGALWLPGPYERNRFLALELKTGALDGAQGLVSATGEPEGQPDLAALVAGAAQSVGGLNRAA